MLQRPNSRLSAVVLLSSLQDTELSLIKRLKELQLRAVALVGTAFLSVMVGVANFMSRVAYDGIYADPK